MNFKFVEINTWNTVLLGEKAGQLRLVDEPLAHEVIGEPSALLVLGRHDEIVNLCADAFVVTGTGSVIVRFRNAKGLNQMDRARGVVQELELQRVGRMAGLVVLGRDGLDALGEEVLPRVQYVLEPNLNNQECNMVPWETLHLLKISNTWMVLR